MEKTYYYRVGEQQVGPVSLDQMRGAVNLDTYVWSEGMANWQTVSQLPDLMAQLGLSTYQQAAAPTQPAQPSQPSYQTSYNAENISAKPPKPNNHLVMAIISIFICQPLGIIATIMAIMSDSAYNRGDYEEAEKKAKTAKTLSMVGLIIGLLFWVLYIGLAVVGALSGAYSSY